MTEPERVNRPAVFLDRDGVIIANRVDHVKTWDEVEFLPGAFEALRRLAEADIPVVIVTNQGAVGRGMMTSDVAWELQARIVAEIETHGGRVAGSYLCPHHPEDGCTCRKPMPGMICQASRDLGLSISHSIMVGDAVTDVRAALAAGCRAMLVRTGRGRAQEALLNGEVCTTFDDLGAVVASIVADRNHHKDKPAS
jgi:D-glycero-D-manno-heptose 1,7-bisphosphate phosphatase